MKKNKLLAVLLALAMTLSLLPTAALATGETRVECTEESCTHEAAVTSGQTTLHYAKLQDAIAAVPVDVSEASTVMILKNVENVSTVQIVANQKIILDLNGKNITAAVRSDDANKHYYAIDNHGNFTLKDTSAGSTGTITARGIENLGDGVMTIESGKIEACDTNGGACIWNEGTLTINGGTFKTTHVGSSSDPYGVGCLNNGGTALITGGNFEGANKRTYAIISTGKIAITPANDKAVNVAGAHGGLAIDSGTAVVNGGSYSSTEYYGLYVSNDGVGTDPRKAAVTVNGGSFTGPNYSVWIGSDYNNPVNSTIEINGGTFNKPLNAQECTRDGAISIKGGTFSSDPSAYLTNGFSATGSDGTWAVSAPVAKIGDVKYGTLSAAIAAAQTGDTINVLPGTINETINYNTGNNDENGKSITIIGAGTDQTFLTGGIEWGYDNNHTRNHSVTIQGITFQGKGVTIKDVGTVVIKNNKFSNIVDENTITVLDQEYDSVEGSVTIGNNIIDTVRYTNDAQKEFAGINLRNPYTVSITGNSIKNTCGSSIVLQKNSNNYENPGTVTIIGNTLENWANNTENGRAIRAAFASGGAVEKTVTIENNKLLRASIGEEFIKVTGIDGSNNHVSLEKNYWGGNNPSITQGILTADGVTVSTYFVEDTMRDPYDLNTYVAPVITFNANGGTCETPKITTEEGKISTLPTATREGYTFNGWYTDASGGTKVTTSTVFEANAMIYAQWTAIPSTPSDSGSSGGGGGSTTTPSQPTTSTETKPDGSTTTTESKPDGTVTESNTSKPTTDASGNTSQTTTETSTGKDGVTESKTETVTKPDGSASSTTESTTTKPDGTKTESTTETTVNKDGSTASTTTATTTNKDGTVTESKTEATTSTVTNKDGSTTETKQETTTTSTGSKTESTTVTTVNKDGSTTATTTATTTDKAGTVTASKTESTTNKNGTTTEKTTTTETKANGTVTESKTETTINKDGSSKATTTATVTKADGTKVESKTTATTSLSTNKTTGTVTETKKETTTTSTGVKSEGTTVTQIQKDGTVTSTETVKASDSTGTTATKTTTLDAKGEVTTTAEVSVSSKAVTEAAKTGVAVTIPVEVTATKSASTAPTVSVSVPKTAESVKVELPVQNVTPGTVAVIVNADGTEKIVSTSMVTENGVALKLDGSATVKLVDNAKSFTDVPETNVFYNEISSLSARNIMIGVSNEKFDLHNSVTLDQVANVAGRITGAVDVKDFNAGVAWGKDGGLKTGNVSATRGDVLKALYIAAGSPTVEDTSILTRFKDASSIPADLAAIAAWAAQNGILKGNMDGTAGLSNNVTRGQACALAGRTMGTLA